MAKAPDYQLESRMIHGKMESNRWTYRDHIVPPISASTSYRLETTGRGAQGFSDFANPEHPRGDHETILIYDRLDEPSRGMLEDNLAAAEGGDCCITFATGMAAIAAAIGVVVQAGDTVICHRAVYGCTDSLLSRWMPRFGVRVRFLDLSEPAQLEEALDADDHVRVVYGESPCNPSLQLLDLERIATIVAQRNERRSPDTRIWTILDNTFATPFAQRPLQLGFDMAVHSLTKNIGGFGTDMGGAVIAPDALESDLLMFRKDFGGVLSPRAAWTMLVYGLPTLAVRSRQQMASANTVAHYLASRDELAQVVYPGLEHHPQHALARRQMRDFDGHFAPGTMIYFVLDGAPEVSRERGARLMDALATHALTITLAVSLGQVRTLIEHPASMTHAPVPAKRQAEAGIEPGGIRLSIGLEPAADLIADLERAFDAISRPEPTLLRPWAASAVPKTPTAHPPDTARSSASRRSTS